MFKHKRNEWEKEKKTNSDEGKETKLISMPPCHVVEMEFYSYLRLCIIFPSFVSLRTDWAKTEQRIERIRLEFETYQRRKRLERWYVWKHKRSTQSTEDIVDMFSGISLRRRRQVENFIDFHIQP